jgi:hypothetical protein
MDKMLVYNVKQGGELEWDYVTQQVVDPDGSVLHGNHVAVLISLDADNELTAQTLDMVAADLREFGAAQLYKVADKQAA